MSFLPINKQEMENHGWNQPDFIYVIGDAYVDHPSFGPAIISRTLEAHGYKVVILSQPDWNKDGEFLQFGTPKLGFLVSSGNIDSMVNHYSVNKRRRDKDFYTDNGEMGKRPDRATIVYTQKIRSLFPDSSIIIGGIEASLRRLSHYDYWDNRVRRSILMDSQADLLLYGMGERTIIETADALNAGIHAKDIVYIKGSCYKTKDISLLEDYILLPSFEKVRDDKVLYARSFQVQHENIDAITAKMLIEPYQGWYIVQNTPALPLSCEEMDAAYALPYERTFHPSYSYIPAIEEVQFSIISNRGCFGSCAFCAITHHQGRVITSRSDESILEEAQKITEMPNFKGYIHDVGGPTANFHHPSCEKQLTHGTCKQRECLFPNPCKNLDTSHTNYVNMLRKLRKLPKIKKVFVRSGIRYDYAMLDKNDEFMRELVQHHISGQLKVAPEHISPKALDKMGKPRKHVYLAFVKKYEELNREYNKNQFLVPYLMSSHPGCDLDAAVELAQYLKSINHIPKQVQDFYPTPGTPATCMYYTGLDPKTLQPVYVAKDYKEKATQRALMQFTYPQNYDLVYDGLKKANRLDLVSHKASALISPRNNSSRGTTKVYQNPRKRNKMNKSS